MTNFVNQNSTAHYDPIFSKKLGPVAAIVLSRIIWSINHKAKNSELQYLIGDNWWMWNTIAEFCEYAGISRDSFLTAKRKLEEANLIIVQKMDSKTLDHTNHYSLNIKELFNVFPHTNPNFGIRPTIDSGESLPSIVENPYHRELGIPTIDSGESLLSIVGIPDDVTKSLSKNPSKSLSKNLTKIKSPPNPPRGEEEKGGGILLNNLISFGRGEERGELKENNPLENRKTIPPVRSKIKSIRTYPPISEEEVKRYCEETIAEFGEPY